MEFRVYISEILIHWYHQHHVAMDTIRCEAAVSTYCYRSRFISISCNFFLLCKVVSTWFETWLRSITAITRVIRVIRPNNHCVVAGQQRFFQKWKVVGVGFEPLGKNPATYHDQWSTWCRSWFCTRFGQIYSKKVGCLGRCERIM